MKKILIFILGLWGIAQAQTTGYFRYDTIRLQKGGGNSELYIENATRGVTGGVFTNQGSGRGAWVAPSGASTASQGLSITAGDVQLGATGLGATVTGTRIINGHASGSYSIPLIRFDSVNFVTRQQGVETLISRATFSRISAPLTSSAYSDYLTGRVYSFATDSLSMAAGATPGSITSYLKIRPLYAEQYAPDSLIWRTTDRTAGVFIAPNTTEIYGGAKEIEVTSSGIEFTLGSDATGDIWYRNSSGFMTRLPIGTTAQRLGISGGLPAWRDTAAVTAQVYPGAGIPVSTGSAWSTSITPATGIATWLTTPSSANLRSALTDENGTGAALFDAATTPTFTTGIRIGGAAASRKMIVGNGTNFVQSTETYAVPGTAGNIMTSDGTNWTSAAPSGLTNPMTTTGDMIYSSSGSTPARLGIQDNEYMLAAGSVPAWQKSSGRFTPTTSGETNCTASFGSEVHWLRSGLSVTVYGKVNIDPTLTATATSFEMDLPVASNFADDTYAGGTGWSPSIIGSGLAILSTSGSNTVTFSFKSSDITSQDYYFSFTYYIQ